MVIFFIYIEYEILKLNLYKYINVESFYSLQLVCKKFNILFKNDICWKYFLIQMLEKSEEWKEISIKYQWYFYILYRGKYMNFDSKQLPAEYFRELIIRVMSMLKVNFF